jgi:hypothetical protein
MKVQKLASFLVCLLLTATFVWAQFETAEVLGTVTDPSGSAVAGASVTLANLDTGIQVKALTDANGNFDFFNVKVGRYSVTVEHAGFSKASASDIAVSVGARQRVDLAMKIGAVSETVEVKGAAAALDTDSSEHSQLINQEQVVELPLNGRNYSDLALLATNVHKSPMSNTVGPTSTPREGAINVNGMRSTYNNFLLDGVDNNADGTSNQGYSNQVAQPSPDALAEFKIVTNNYAAEYGRAGGAVINAVLRSGSNAFHGTAYEFLRNTDLNAIGFTFSPTTFQKPTLQRNQFGFTIGGPFIKNKLFFFADYEGQRQLQNYLNYDSIPDSTDRAGTLPVAVVNNYTGVLYPANTPIPISTINPFAAYVLNQLPAQNGAGRSNNYAALLLIRDYYDKFDTKVDYHINDKMSAFLRFSQRKDLQYYAPDIPGFSGGDGNGFIHAIAQNASAGYTWTVTNTSLLEFRFAYNHMVAGKEPAELGGEGLEQLFGMNGLPTSPSLTGGLNSQSLSGFTQLGRQTSNPQFQNPETFDPKLNYSWMKGRHAFKFGYEFQAIRTEVLDVNPLYGEEIYAGSFSKPTCAQLGQASGCTFATDATSYNLADFIFGTPSSIQLGSDTVVNLRQHINSLYAQDDYHPTSKLTFNLGLRYDFATPLYERDNNYSNFDPTTDTMIKASGGSLFNRALVHPNYTNFGPRLGVAYSVAPKTVIRAGYAISYDFFERVGSAAEGINAPQALFGVISQSFPAGGPIPSTFLNSQCGLASPAPNQCNVFTTNIASPAAFNPANSNVVYTPPNSPWPMVQSWFFSVQRELPWHTVLEVAYTGNHSTNLPIIADYNEANPNAATGTVALQQRLPIPSFGPITWLDPAGNNHYDAMSVRLEHRMGSGLYWLNSFTWGHGIGDSEQALEYGPGQSQANPQNIHDLAAEAGPSSFDEKFMNVSSLVYQLPYGRGRKWGSSANPVVDAFLGGWEMNTILSSYDGMPLNVVYTPAAANQVSALSNDYRGEPFLRPNVSGSAVSQTKGQMVNTYFAGYTFSTPPQNDPFGNLGRNAFRAPGQEQWDFATNKTFTIRESVHLQFRSEFFNLLNHTNFAAPTLATTSSAFGTIRSTFPSRQIQFGLKLLF